MHRGRFVSLFGVKKQFPEFHLNLWHAPLTIPLSVEIGTNNQNSEAYKYSRLLYSSAKARVSSSASEMSISPIGPAIARLVLA